MAAVRSARPRPPGVPGPGGCGWLPVRRRGARRRPTSSTRPRVVMRTGPRPPAGCCARWSGRRGGSRRAASARVARPISGRQRRSPDTQSRTAPGCEHAGEGRDRVRGAHVGDYRPPRRAVATMRPSIHDRGTRRHLGRGGLPRPPDLRRCRPAARCHRRSRRGGRTRGPRRSRRTTVAGIDGAELAVRIVPTVVPAYCRSTHAHGSGARPTRHTGALSASMRTTCGVTQAPANALAAARTRPPASSKLSSWSTRAGERSPSCGFIPWNQVGTTS